MRLHGGTMQSQPFQIFTFFYYCNFFPTWSALSLDDTIFTLLLDHFRNCRMIIFLFFIFFGIFLVGNPSLAKALPTYFFPRRLLIIWSHNLSYRKIMKISHFSFSWGPPVAERNCAQNCRQEMPGSNPGRSYRPSRSEFSVVLSETCLNTF